MMYLNLHEDAFGVGGKPRVNWLELRSSFQGVGIPVTAIEILIPQECSLLRGIGIVGVNLCDADEVYGLS